MLREWALLDAEGEVCGTLVGTPGEARRRLSAEDRQAPTAAPHFVALAGGES